MLNKIEMRIEHTLLCILGFYVLICEGSDTQGSQAKVIPIGNFKPMTTNAPVKSVKLTAANAVSISAPKDGLIKRNIKFKDLSNSNTATAKSYDPPPEYYRGPGSTVSTSLTTLNGYAAHDNTASGYNLKPVTFPDASERSKHSDVAGQYNSWQLLRGSSTQGYTQNGQGTDRISVGHYGSPDHSTSHGGTASTILHSTGVIGDDGRGGGGGYGGYGGYGHNAKHPYDNYHNDYVGSGPQYPVHGTESHYYDSNEAGGIAFDLYGTKGHYAGSGGEYSYSSYPDVHEPVAHKGHGIDWQHKALLAKSFLIPLASAAVLGIAAALVSNPLLLQLGTVSAPTLVGKRRKRRDLDVRKLKDENAVLAYRAHQRHGHMAGV